MEHITLRVPDGLLEEIDDSLGPEESRSEWLRGAARHRLDGEAQAREDWDEIARRLERLEAKVEAQQNRTLLDRLF